MMRLSQTFGSSVMGFVVVLSSILASQALAQAGKSKKPMIPKPEAKSFEGLGGVTINFVYFAGGYIQKSETEVVSKPGKEVVPIILLHGFEGRAADMQQLALFLQRQGHAVVVPDLRGHGSSRLRSLRGKDDIPPQKLTKNDFAAMVDDIEGLKKFLLEQNKAGFLNIEMLCLVGADLGGIIATNWIAADWSRQDLPAFKQGKYAKGLVVLSPVPSVKGYSASIAWNHPIFQTSPKMSVMLVAGTRDSKSHSEAKQIFNKIEKTHLTDAAVPDKAKQTLWLIEPDTDLSGTKLVDPRTRLNLSQQISLFINARLADRPEFKWEDRKSPLDSQ